MSVNLKINKKVTVSDTQAKTYTVTLSVEEAQGITPNIFVLRFNPGSKYTGPESYTFWNVAYLDELESVPENPANRRASCEVRKSCFTHHCTSLDALNEFMSIVISDIQRLIKSVESSGSDLLCSNLNITSETAVELPCSDCESVGVQYTDDQSTGSVVSLSFTGE